MASRPPLARNEATWHRLGMGLSALCLLHCLVLPWLLMTLPVTVLAALPEGLRENSWVHVALIAPVLLASGPVLLRGCPGLRQRLIVGTALVALVGGLFAPSEAGEQGLTLAGTLLLLAAHWRRLREIHRYRHACHDATVR